jgi:hypothetical protein
MDVWPKVAPENAEDAKGFLDSANDAGDDGLNSVVYAVQSQHFAS